MSTLHKKWLKMLVFCFAAVFSFICKNNGLVKEVSMFSNKVFGVATTFGYSLRMLFHIQVMP